MPPAARGSTKAATAPPATIGSTAPGDLLWARAGNHSWWPGQVMDPATAPQHMQHAARPNSVLLNFFGDNTIGFFPHSLLQPFEAFKAQALQAQKLKTAKAKAYFQLAVEQAQEMLDRRAGRPPATEHHPVDFTRPETWPEGWSGSAAGEGGAADGADEEQQLRMCYPAEPSADDVAAASAVQVLQLLQLLAAAPHAHASDAGAAGEGGGEAGNVATAALRQLWSLLHTRAVQQHGQGARSKCFPAPPQAQQPAAGGEAGDGAGSDPKASAAAGSKAKAAGSKRKASDGAAAGGTRPKGGRGPAAAAAAAAGDDGGDDSAALSECQEAVEQHEAHLLAWGGSISLITLEQVQQQLVAAATDPHQFVRSWAGRQFKAVAVLMRWREAAMAQSTTRRKGRLPEGLQGVLERAEAMPMVSPGLPASQGEPRLLAASCLGRRRGKQQGAPSDAAAAANGSRGNGGRGSSSSSSSSSSDDDGDDDNDDDGSKGKGTKRPRQARASGRRGAAAASPVQAALADLKTAAEGGRQQRQALLQRRAAAAVDDEGDSDSDFDGAQDGGGGGGGRKQQQRRPKQQQQQQRSVSPSPTAPKAAAAAAPRGEEVSVACFEYAAQVPDSREAFSARLQRFLGESGSAASLSKPDDDSADLHTLFKLVAALGGSAAVTKRGAWTAVAKDKAWAGSGHRALSGARLKALYDRRLAPFERSFTARAPVKHITIRLAPPPAAAAASKPAAAGAGRGKPPAQAAAAAAANTRLDRASRQQKLAAAGLGGEGLNWKHVNSIWRGGAGGPAGSTPPAQGSADRQRPQQQHSTALPPSQHQQQQAGGGGGRAADLRRLLLQFSPDDAAPSLGDVFLAARRFEPSLLSSAVVNQTLVPRKDRLRFLAVTFGSVAAATEAEGAFARYPHRLLHLNSAAVQVRVKRVDANDSPSRRPQQQHQQQLQQQADRARGGWVAEGDHGSRYEPSQSHQHQHQQQQQPPPFYSAAPQPPLHHPQQQQHMPPPMGGIPGLSGGGVVMLPGGIVTLPAAAMQQPGMPMLVGGAPHAGMAHLGAPPVDPRRALQQAQQQPAAPPGVTVDVNALLSMLQSNAPPPPAQQ